jgi:hypothetical protein
MAGIQRILNSFKLHLVERLPVHSEPLPFDGKTGRKPYGHYPFELLTSDGLWFFVPDASAGPAVRAAVYRQNRELYSRQVREPYHFTSRQVSLVSRDLEWRKPQDGDMDLSPGYIVYREPGSTIRPRRKRRSQRRAGT